MSGNLKAICQQAARTATALGRAMKRTADVRPSLCADSNSEPCGCHPGQEVNSMENMCIQGNSADSGTGLEELVKGIWNAFLSV